jgi:site-specific DNA-methyltransferase (adenine-specific)
VGNKMISMNKVYESDVMMFLDKLKNNSIDLAIVDPPYNMNKGEWDIFKNEKEYFEFTFKWIDSLVPKLRTNSSIYIFNNAYNSALILPYLKEKSLDFRNWITWYKRDGLSASKKKYVNAQETILFFTKGENYIFNYNEIRIEYESKERIKHAVKKGILKNGKRWFPNPNGKLCTDVWEFSSHRHKTKVNGKIVKIIHPTPKPEDMIERIMLASSNENSLVLDLFSGTGVASMVAKKYRRTYIGCENNAEYIKMIAERGIKIGRL